MSHHEEAQRVEETKDANEVTQDPESAELADKVLDKVAGGAVVAEQITDLEEIGMSGKGT